jgi:putative tricarboxylic transport membrane protein
LGDVNSSIAPAWRPEREVELIAGTPAGGGQDRPARVLIELLAGAVGRPITLTNIAGRGGGNGWDYLAKHSGDPHKLAINSPTIITNRLLGESTLDYASLTPLANLYTEYLVFVVRPGGAIRDARDLLAKLAADTACVPIAFATAIGNMNHIALGKITQAVGGNVRALATTVFDSARYAVAHVVDGHAELGVITATSAVPELAAGSLRAIAVSAPARMTAPFDAVPHWAELGIDCVVGTWRGVIAAGGLAAAHISFWEHALARATQTAQWRAELARHHWVDTYMGAAQTRAFLDREQDVMADVLGALGLIYAKGRT